MAHGLDAPLAHPLTQCGGRDLQGLGRRTDEPGGLAGPAPGEYLAYSCFINVRSRGLDEHHQIAGRREDVLRLEADGLKLLKRKILIPNAMLLCKNINTFL